MPGIKIVRVSLCPQPSPLSVAHGRHGTSCSNQTLLQRTNGVAAWVCYWLPGGRRYFLFPVRARAFLRGSFAQEMSKVTFAVESWHHTEVSHNLKKMHTEASELLLLDKQDFWLICWLKCAQSFVHWAKEGHSGGSLCLRAACRQLLCVHIISVLMKHSAAPLHHNSHFLC